MNAYLEGTGPICYLPAKCPMCGKVDTQSYFVYGFGKCIECVGLIKKVRKERGVYCSCVCLFFGRTVGTPLMAYMDGWDNPLAKVD